MNLLDLFGWDRVMSLLKNGWYDLLDTDFQKIKFTEINTALYIGLALALLVLLMVVLRRDKSSRGCPGYLTSDEDEQGFISKFVLVFPKLLLALSVLVILVAISDPFFAVIKEEKQFVETRTRTDLRDVSGSMVWPFAKTGKSKAEIAQRAHLKFLKMRRGKNDRTSFWIFADNPYKISGDFVVDDELYYFQVYGAPWVMGGTPDYGINWSKQNLPRSRYKYIFGEGGTTMATALIAIISSFDEDEKEQQKLLHYKRGGRAILMLTDAAIGDFDNTAKQFEAMGKRNIVPFIIFIDESGGEGNPQSLASVAKLLKLVTDSGGKYFPVSDESSILKAFQEIDKLEKVKVEVTRRVLRIPLYQKFIFLSILTLLIIIPIGLVAQLFGVYP